MSRAERIAASFIVLAVVAGLVASSARSGLLRAIGLGPRPPPRAPASAAPPPACNATRELAVTVDRPAAPRLELAPLDGGSTAAVVAGDRVWIEQTGGAGASGRTRIGFRLDDKQPARPYDAGRVGRGGWLAIHSSRWDSCPAPLIGVYKVARDPRTGAAVELTFRVRCEPTGALLTGCAWVREVELRPGEVNTAAIGVVAADEGPALVAAAEGEASKAEPCSALPEGPTAPAKPRAPGPLGILVYDPGDGDPPPGYDWRALAERHLPGIRRGQPLPPKLRREAARRHQAQSDSEFASDPVELTYPVPANEVHGAYYSLGLDGFRDLGGSALTGQVSVDVDERGCEKGTRFYQAHADWLPEPVAWAPAPITWKDEHEVPAGAGGVRLDVAGGEAHVVLEERGHSVRSGAIPYDDLGCEGAAGGRVARLEPGGARILLVKGGDRCYWVFRAKETELELLGSVIRGDL